MLTVHILMGLVSIVLSLSSLGCFQVGTSTRRASWWIGGPIHLRENSTAEKTALWNSIATTGWKLDR